MFLLCGAEAKLYMQDNESNITLLATSTVTHHVQTCTNMQAHHKAKRHSEPYEGRGAL